MNRMLAILGLSACQFLATGACYAGEINLSILTPSQVELVEVQQSQVMVAIESTPGSIFECSLDGRVSAPCKSRFGTGYLTDGTHELVIKDNTGSSRRILIRVNTVNK